MARFRLGNGAPMHDIHARADMSVTVPVQSGGTMVKDLDGLGKAAPQHGLSASQREDPSLIAGTGKAIG